MWKMKFHIVNRKHFFSGIKSFRSRWIHSKYIICIQFTFQTLVDARMVLHQLQLFKDIFQLAVQKVEQTFFSFQKLLPFASCKSYKETRHHQFHILCWWHIMNSSAFPALLAEAFLFLTRNTVFENWKKVSFYWKINWHFHAENRKSKMVT